MGSRSRDVVLRSRGGRVSLRPSRRVLWCTGVGAAAALLLVFAALLLGDFVISPRDLWLTLQGAPPDPRMEFFVLERRLPRAVVALTVGASLACGGALFQGVTRNPLATPDILGISAGASTGACGVILLAEGSIAQAAVGAIVGAAVATAAIGAFAWKGGVGSARLVLAGLAIGALCTAVTNYLLTLVFVGSAVTAQMWLVGTLQGRGWREVTPLLVAMAVVVPFVLWRERALRAVELGEEHAVGLGVVVWRERAALLLGGTVLVAFAVAAAGPISFVALVAPQISRLLCRSSALIPAMLTGGVLLLVADLIAQYAFAVPMPVGVVTIVLGGAFFLWLLLGAARKR